MTTRGYTVLGWLAWQILSRVVGRKLAAEQGEARRGRDGGRGHRAPGSWPRARRPAND